MSPITINRWLPSIVALCRWTTALRQRYFWKCAKYSQEFNSFINQFKTHMPEKVISGSENSNLLLNVSKVITLKEGFYPPLLIFLIISYKYFLLEAIWNCVNNFFLKKNQRFDTILCFIICDFNLYRKWYLWLKKLLY